MRPRAQQHLLMQWDCWVGSSLLKQLGEEGPNMKPKEEAGYRGGTA